jgi:hypothetical protein
VDASASSALLWWFMKVDLEERVKLCDCARCGQTMLGIAMIAARYLGPYQNLPLVRGRVEGRPYCRECFQKAKDSARERFVRPPREPPAEASV